MLKNIETFLQCIAIFGLKPYTKNNNKRQQICTLLFFLFNISITVYGIIQLKHDYNEISNFTRKLLLAMQLAAVATIILETLCTSTEHSRFHTQCRRIEFLFRSQLHYTFCEHTRRKHILWKYGLMTLIGICCPLIYIWLTTINNYHSYMPYVLCSLAVLRLRQTQFSIYAEVIGWYIQALNWKLLALVSCKIQHKRQLLDIKYKWLESLEYLLLLKTLYLEICNLTECWNTCFGWSTLVVITTLFLDIVFYGYWTFLTFAEVYPTFLLFGTMKMLISLMILISTVCQTCQQREDSCRQTLALVQRLLLTTAGDFNVRIYNDLVNEFATQIKNNPLEFGAYGIFRINLKFLMEILTALAGHLMIMIQFRTADTDADPSQKNNSKKCYVHH